MKQSSLSRSIPVITLAAATLLAGCATTGSDEPQLSPRKENIVAVTASNQLITFNAGQPQKVLSKKAVTGLQAGEEIAGIDYRVAKGVLYALGKTGTVGRLYTIDVASGKATIVGAGPFAVALEGDEFGFDFNPVVDRIRLVNSSGLNARLHPDTGAAVDANPNMGGVQTDGKLAFANTDPNAGKSPAVMAAGYTYNKQNDKITTNYAVDGKLDMLVMQGSKEGTTPPVSPNSGQLFTVGRIGAGESARVSFDIADVNNAAFGAFTKAGASSTRFYLVNLDTGAGTFHGTIGGGEVIKGIAIEP